MKILWLPQIVFDSDGGGSKGGSSNDSGSSKSTPAPAPKAAAPAPKPAATPSFKSLTEASKAGYHGKTVNINGKSQKVAFADKSYDKKMAKASASAGTSSVSAASKPKTGTSRVSVTSTKNTTPVDTSFADAILSGAKKDVLAPTLTKAASKASQPNIFEKAAAAKMFKDDYGVDVSKPITSRPLSRTPSNTAGLTQSNVGMINPYEATGGIFTSQAQKSPGYMGVQGTPQNDYEEFLERYNAQSIAAAADPRGMSTATGVAITPSAQKMLDDAGMTAGEYQKAVMDLGASLDEPRFGEGMVGKMLDATMVGKGLDYLGDMQQRRAYEQLTGQYEATPLGKLAGYGGADVDRVVPVIKDGKIVGSLEVNAKGEAVSYTGDRGSGAKPADATVTDWEDKVAAPKTVADIGGGGDGDAAVAGTTEEVVTPDPVCPEGYMYDKDKGQCVIDPFQQPFQETPGVTGGASAATMAQLSPYTEATPFTLPALNPSYVAGQQAVTAGSPIALSGIREQMRTLPAGNIQQSVPGYPPGFTPRPNPDVGGPGLASLGPVLAQRMFGQGNFPNSGGGGLFFG